MFLDSVDGGDAEYAKAYRMATRGLRAINWDVSGESVEVDLTVECDCTVCLPDDFINLVRIGVVNARGEVAELTENPQLTLDTGYRQGREYEFDEPFEYRPTGGTMRSYGKGSLPNIGEFTVDKGANLIILNPDFFYETVRVKYLKRRKSGEDYLVDELVQEALIAWLRWQWFISKKGVSTYEKETYRRDWFNEKRLSRARINNVTKQTLNQMAKQSSRLAPKI